MPEIKEESREATSIKIKPSVWRNAKKAAIDEGITVSELVEQAIQDWINQKSAAITDEEAEQIAKKYLPKKEKQ